MQQLLKEIRGCTYCVPQLELGPNPVLSGHPDSKIVIIGQAPGRAVHHSSIPWDDKSGNNLRDWLGVDKSTFYDPRQIAIIPMGFCYPGKGKSGDLPPKKECAPLWHFKIWEHLRNVELTLLIGQYAQERYLKEKAKRTLTETVRSFKEYLPKYFVLPHPSPRNNIWRAKNEWFDNLILPLLKEKISTIIKQENACQ